MYNDTNFSPIATTNPLAVLDPPRKEPRNYTLAEYLRREEYAKELQDRKSVV